MLLLRALVGLCCLGLGACSDGPPESTMPPSPPEAIYASDGDVEYTRGTLPIIVTAPHGGLMRPEAIPDRTEGELLNDAKTQELARLLATALSRNGERPHLVVNHLHRRKLDANRPLEDATAGDPRAESAWSAYHAFIEQARAEVVARHERGLLIDVHGHSHDVDWVELGYLVTSKELALDEPALEALAPESSLRNLAAVSPLSFAELLRGVSSLGSRLSDAGYASVPSPEHPTPDGMPYLSGGYTLRRHGPSDGLAVDAVQVETYKPGIRDARVHRVAFAAALASAVQATFSLGPP